MTKAYYWKSQVWGVTYFFIALYYIHLFQPSVNVPLSLVAAILSLLLYPFAKKAIETAALQFTSEEFWHRGLFADTIGKNGVLILYYAFCYVMALPLGTLYLLALFLRNKKAA
ncbi:colicin E1 family microcin immunity protein [Serratia marcescens]|uniref:colicin E1 family microcin immunity protein n=1 Tax=Serratia marcescens TaxID=615 RepID=UPI0027E46EFD|nr:colicin E1 family microcin immunity protein [Serratia marcescens]MDH2267580.1 colicin E1 family microcin immunity protein [Serratia marcescens]MDH2275557.1 colicin E1 family microcin immunity protein [Serratia marcescens]